MPERKDRYSDSDNNGQRRAKERGEHRNGRLSEFKNLTTEDGAYPTEYSSRKEEEQEQKE